MDTDSSDKPETPDISSPPTSRVDLPNIPPPVVDENITNFSVAPPSVEVQTSGNAGAFDPQSTPPLAMDQNPAGLNPPPRPRKLLSKRVFMIGLPIVLLLLAAGAAAAYFLVPPSPQKVLDMAKLNIQKIKTFDFSGKIVADITTPSGLFGMNTLLHGLPGNSDTRIAGTSTNKISFDFTGSTDITDANNPKSDVSFNFNYSVFTFGVQVRTLGQILYLKLLQIPKLGAYDLSKYSNTWIKIDPAEVAKQYGVGLDLSNKGADLTAGQKQQLTDAYNKTNFVTNITKLADDSIDGLSMYHYSFDIDQAGLKSYLDQLYKIENAGADANTQFEDAISKIQFNSLEIWVGKKDKMPYRVSGQIFEKPMPGVTNSVSGTLNVLFNFKNFNKPSQITVPTDFKTLSDFITDMTSTTNVNIGQASAQSRDARRLADVRQIMTALELYYNDHSYYPFSSKGQPSNQGLGKYMAWPLAPTPADGTCTTDNNNYNYTWVSKDKYTLAFCLGADNGSYKAGMHTASPDGIK